MNTVKYFVFPAGKPEEKFEVLPHTFGNGFVGFADAKLAGTDGWNKPEVLYKWENENKDGAFVNNDVEQLDLTGVYDIVKVEAPIFDSEAGE